MLHSTFTTCVLLATFVLLLVGDGVDAHMRLITPVPRSDSDSAKGAGPCYGTGKLAGQNPTTYESGSTVDIVVEETVNHTGWIRVAFAKAPASGDTPTQEDFDANVLRMVEDPSQAGAAQRSISVTIPNYACDDCVLQVIQVMSRFGSNYFMCADIKITAPSAGATAYEYGSCAPDRDDNPVTTAGFSDKQYACGGAYPGRPVGACTDPPKVCPSGVEAERNADCTFKSCIRCWVGTEVIHSSGGGTQAVQSKVEQSTMQATTCSTSCKMTMLKEALQSGEYDTSYTYVGSCLAASDECQEQGSSTADAWTDCYASADSTTDGPKRVPDATVNTDTGHTGCLSTDCNNQGDSGASTAVASVIASLVMAVATALLMA